MTSNCPRRYCPSTESASSTKLSNETRNLGGTNSAMIATKRSQSLSRKNSATGINTKLPTNAKATLPPSLSEDSTDPIISSKFVLRYLTTKALMLATSKDTLMPNCASHGPSELLSRPASKGSCSRSKGNSLAKIGTTSNAIDSKISTKSTSTSSTASTRGTCPRPILSILFTTGVSA